MEQSMEVGMQDPNNTSALGSQGQGPFSGKDTPQYGKTKISKSATPPHPTEQVGYGYMSPDLKNVGMAPSGENSSGIPAAQPIDPITFGDPNGTAVDFKDGAGSLDSIVISGANNTYTRRGFETTDSDNK